MVSPLIRMALGRSVSAANAGAVARPMLRVGAGLWLAQAAPATRRKTNRLIHQVAAELELTAGFIREETRIRFTNRSHVPRHAPSSP